MKIGKYELQVPFVTTSSDKLKSLLELADLNDGMRAVDLGCGDGRVLLEFAKTGARVYGYEINNVLRERAHKRARDAGFEQQITIHPESFWDADLSQFDLIYIYGMQSIMGRLEQKLEKEMKPGAKCITNIFRLPHWKVRREKQTLYLYTKK